MSDRVVVSIDYGAIQQNLRRVRDLVPNCRIACVVKADAYGHGLVGVADSLARVADAFAVATVEEGLRLRSAGIRCPVWVLSAFTTPDQLTQLSMGGLTPVIHNAEQLSWITSDSSFSGSVLVKIDTGMGRLGFDPDSLPGVVSTLRNVPRLSLEVVMSHLASADLTGDPLTNAQRQKFERATATLGIDRSLANSAAILDRPELAYDWVRPGLMLYGISPFEDRSGVVHHLKPAMELKSILIAIRELPAGHGVGYGASFVCPEPMKVGIVGCGYGDGYPRHAGGRASALVAGVVTPLVGRVSMDSLAVDLRGCPEARVGDEVTLWGGDLPVERVAAAAGTIPYELVCKLTSRVCRRPSWGGETAACQESVR